MWNLKGNMTKTNYESFIVDIDMIYWNKIVVQ
jgi:hypothetical protein